MPRTLTGNGTIAHEEADKILQVVAETLAADGFDVGRSHEDKDLLTIDNVESMRCHLAVYNDGYVAWEYWPRNGKQAHPADVARLVAHALDAGPTDPHGPDKSAPRGGTMKSLVGQELKAHGLHVRLAVYEDPIGYDVTADIVATNPAQPQRGKVHISDDGAVTWECDYHQPDGCDPEKVAASIADVLTCGIRGSDL